MASSAPSFPPLFLNKTSGAVILSEARAARVAKACPERSEGDLLSSTVSRSGHKKQVPWWLYPYPTDSTRFVLGGSGFGGQTPMALQREDMVIVFNAWNIIPGRPTFPRGRTLARILAGVK